MRRALCPACAAGDCESQLGRYVFVEWNRHVVPVELDRASFARLEGLRRGPFLLPAICSGAPPLFDPSVVGGSGPWSGFALPTAPTPIRYDSLRLPVSGVAGHERSTPDRTVRCSANERGWSRRVIGSRKFHSGARETPGIDVLGRWPRTGCPPIPGRPDPQRIVLVGGADFVRHDHHCSAPALEQLQIDEISAIGSAPRQIISSRAADGSGSQPCRDSAQDLDARGARRRKSGNL